MLLYSAVLLFGLLPVISGGTEYYKVNEDLYSIEESQGRAGCLDANSALKDNDKDTCSVAIATESLASFEWDLKKPYRITKLELHTGLGMPNLVHLKAQISNFSLKNSEGSSSVIACSIQDKNLYDERMLVITCSKPIAGQFLQVIQEKPEKAHFFLCESELYVQGRDCYGSQFSADCMKECHCAYGVKCHEVTGKCPNYCSTRYHGEACDKKCPLGTFADGGGCSGTCHCLDEMSCRADNGRCEQYGCLPGWKGLNCQDNGFNDPEHVLSLVAKPAGTFTNSTIVSLAVAPMVVIGTAVAAYQCYVIKTKPLYRKSSNQSSEDNKTQTPQRKRRKSATRSER